MGRRLLVTQRTVPLDCIEDYHAAWSRIRDSVSRLGGRAWLFRAVGHEDHYMEFLEWEEGAVEVPYDPDIAGARRELDATLPPARADEWEEAGPP